MSFSKEYAQMVRDQKNLIPFLHPLTNGGEFNHLYRKKNRCIIEYNHFLRLAENGEWEQVPAILEALHNPSTAIVLTDSTERIEWVKQAFIAWLATLFRKV